MSCCCTCCRRRCSRWQPQRAAVVPCTNDHDLQACGDGAGSGGAVDHGTVNQGGAAGALCVRPDTTTNHQAENDSAVHTMLFQAAQTVLCSRRRRGGIVQQRHTSQSATSAAPGVCGRTTCSTQPGAQSSSAASSATPCGPIRPESATAGQERRCFDRSCRCWGCAAADRRWLPNRML